MINNFLGQNTTLVDSHAFTSQESDLLFKINKPVSTDPEYQRKFNEDSCPICMEELKSYAIDLNGKQGQITSKILESGLVYHPVCHHLFHVVCLTEWLEKKPSCPVCRKGSRSGMLEEIRNHQLQLNYPTA